MSKIRHRKSGGGLPMVASGNPNVIKEAEEKKRGGRAKRKDGGKVIGLMTGGSVKPRMDRPGRKRGGAVGANKMPLSTAHRTTSPGSDGETRGGAAD